MVTTKTEHVQSWRQLPTRRKSTRSWSWEWPHRTDCLRLLSRLKQSGTVLACVGVLKMIVLPNRACVRRRAGMFCNDLIVCVKNRRDVTHDVTRAIALVCFRRKCITVPENAFLVWRYGLTYWITILNTHIESIYLISNVVSHNKIYIWHIKHISNMSYLWYILVIYIFIHTYSHLFVIPSVVRFSRPLQSKSLW